MFAPVAPHFRSQASVIRGKSPFSVVFRRQLIGWLTFQHLKTDTFFFESFLPCSPAHSPHLLTTLPYPARCLAENRLLRNARLANKPGWPPRKESPFISIALSSIPGLHFARPFFTARFLTPKTDAGSISVQTVSFIPSPGHTFLLPAFITSLFLS
jgi:hypothetical protein